MMGLMLGREWRRSTERVAKPTLPLNLLEGGIDAKHQARAARDLTSASLGAKASSSCVRIALAARSSTGTILSGV